jgi:hypothetical protein
MAKVATSTATAAVSAMNATESNTTKIGMCGLLAISHPVAVAELAPPIGRTIAD